MAAAWLAVAAVVGVLIGRMIRERDRQVPPAPGRPEDASPESPPRRAVGRGRQKRG